MEKKQKQMTRKPESNLVPGMAPGMFGTKRPGRSWRPGGARDGWAAEGIGGLRRWDWLQLRCSEGGPGVVDSFATPGTILPGAVDVALARRLQNPVSPPRQTLGLSPLRVLRALCLSRFGYRTAQVEWAQCPHRFPSGPPLIYVVDDLPALTDLYALVLEGAGYLVKAFNKRARALAALKTERRKPRLLITDYRGDAMPIERFLRDCAAVHPILRILMASGMGRTDGCLASLRLDGFVHKPFTPEELRREVRAALDRR